jgi:hypothetical protein
MGSDNGISSSDENLYSRLGKTDETPRRTSLRTSERRARSSSRSLLQLDEPSCHGITPASVSATPFTEILAEIETARFAVAGAIKKVMVGTQAILHPECTEPGAGPPEIDGILESVRALELKMCATSNGDSVFYMRDPPSADEPIRQPAEARLLSFVSKDVLYLFPWKTGGSVGFGIAVSRDDLRAIQIGDTGRMSYPFMMSLGVTPFLAMPPDGMLAAARENEQRYRDRAGHGFHLPTFVEAYVDFLAFVVQETPAALGALLLCERHPRAAEELVIEHD